ncbi:MAG: Phosphate transport system permease protein PstC [bacterium ADurb.Bin243]|nr:MAG: Phosphate transport system permease protein PstC [bacterium ADurb.Bin243]HOD40302.1 phosphate ABC transporter permease subunit PstC [Candidatus Wallbacteria bacterium]
MKKITGETIIGKILLMIALSSIGALFLITVFIFAEGLPVIFKTGFAAFITGMKWKPTREIFGILPMIAGSFAIMAGAMIVSVPFALCCSIYLAEFAGDLMRRVVKPAIELLAGIPSVVYGFIGVTVLVPFIKNYIGGNGFSVLGCSLVLGVMVLPTITSISYDALRAVPVSYREGALALGATRWQAVKMAVVPAASSGIIAAVILGMGRAIGETMAVIMIAGNSLIVPLSPLDPVRTLTSNIALEMGYASGSHRQALFATGVVLFIIIMALNVLASRIINRAVK